MAKKFNIDDFVEELNKDLEELYNSEIYHDASTYSLKKDFENDDVGRKTTRDI